MNIQITHTITLAPEVLSILQAFVGNLQPKTEAAIEAPAINSKSIATALTATPAPEQEAKTSVAEKTASPAKSDNITLEQVRAAVVAKQSTKRAELKDLLTEFGSPNVTGLAKEKYADFLKRVNEL